MKIPAFMIALLALVSGCSPYAGTYYADARLIPGKQGSNEPGYTLADIQEKVAEGKRSLLLERGGRFTWNTGTAVNEGTWRIEGDTLYLREDKYNGTPIQAALRKDRVWRIDPDGSLVNEGAYSHYGVEVVYAKP